MAVSSNMRSSYASLTGAITSVDVLQEVSEKLHHCPSRGEMCILILDLMQFLHVFKDPTSRECYPVK